MRTTAKHTLAALLAATAVGVHAQTTDDRLCGDQNLDGVVTPADYNAWILNFNTNNPVADVNQDGAVTPADYNAWILAFNQGPDGPGCPVDVASGVQVQGTISFFGDTDIFYINADAGEDIRVALSEPGVDTNLYLYVSIQAPNGDSLAHDWNSYGTDLLAANVPETGRYAIIIRDLNDDGTGAYAMTALVPDNQIDVGNVDAASGTTITHSIGHGDIDTFTIDADAGEDIRLAISEPGVNESLYLYAAIYAPNGNNLAHDWNSYGFDLMAANVPISGTYTIVVQDLYGTGVGDYTLTAVVPDSQVDADNVVLPSGTTTTGAIGIGDIDTFTIDADAGEDIRLAISEPGVNESLYLYAAIYAPNGDNLAHDWNSYGTDLTAANVPETGTYTIVVQDLYGTGVGDYTLTAVVPDNQVDVNNVSLPSGITTTQAVAIADIDTFTISADAGDDVRVAVSEMGVDSGLYLYVAVYAPNGTLLAHDWNSYGTDLTAANVPETGTYTIVVQDLYGTGVGDYALTAVVPDGQADVGSVNLPSGSSTTRNISFADIDTYTVSTAAGKDIRIDAAEPGSDTSLYLYVAIYAPNGDNLAHDWNGYSLDVTAANVPFSGTYTVVVQDLYGTGTGDYSISSVVTP